MEPIIIVIPAINPLPTIVQFVEKLRDLPVEKIIIVNDGSDNKYMDTFEKLHKLTDCMELEHEKNLGKGRALKTGFDYINIILMQKVL